MAIRSTVLFYIFLTSLATAEKGRFYVIKKNASDLSFFISEKRPLDKRILFFKDLTFTKETKLKTHFSDKPQKAPVFIAKGSQLSLPTLVISATFVRPRLPLEHLFPIDFMDVSEDIPPPELDAVLKNLNFPKKLP